MSERCARAGSDERAHPRSPAGVLGYHRSSFPDDPGVNGAMFERYTERARRVIFFARYEASQLGSAAIETEHLLLGLIREGKGLTSRLFSKSHLSMEQIRRDVEGRSPYRGKVSDLGRDPALGREQARARPRRRGSRAHAPQLHRHRAHPARADARGAQRRRGPPGREGHAPRARRARRSWRCSTRRRRRARPRRRRCSPSSRAT